MSYQIRTATPNDFEAILALIKELAAFENASEQVINTVEQMKAEQELFSCFVVEQEDGTIIGMALYYLVYYTWVGKSLYLDDLYIQEAYRGQGIGSALLGELFKVAKQENCKRVRWQVLDWNEPAIHFYKKIGATIDGEWCNCDFDTAGIANFGENF
ncbi:MAG: N-acetyltransferase family protein [Aureispira sp.]